MAASSSRDSHASDSFANACLRMARSGSAIFVASCPSEIVRVEPLCSNSTDKSPAILSYNLFQAW